MLTENDLLNIELQLKRGIPPTPDEVAELLAAARSNCPIANACPWRKPKKEGN